MRVHPFLLGIYLVEKILVFYIITLFYIPLKTIGMPHIYSKLITNIKTSKNNTMIKYLGILVLAWLTIQFIKVISYYLYDKIFPPLSSYVRK